MPFANDHMAIVAVNLSDHPFPLTVFVGGILLQLSDTGGCTIFRETLRGGLPICCTVEKQARGRPHVYLAVVQPQDCGYSSLTMD
jgi:uncharacterized Zn-finger protein